MRLKHSVGIIALNADRTIRLCLEGVYAFAHQILVVEGQAGPAAAFMADAKGGSLDRTKDAVLGFPDPEGKITLFSGQWKDKTAMSNAYASKATGEWLWQVDADEIWDPRALRAIDTRLADDPYDQVNVGFWHYWHDLNHVAVGSEWSKSRPRGWRRASALQRLSFDTHWPPTLSAPPQSDRVLDLGGDPNFRCHHLSFDDSESVERKMYYHANRAQKEYADLPEWYRAVWLPWKIGGPARAPSHEWSQPHGWTRGEHAGVEPFPKSVDRPPALERMAARQANPLRVLHVMPSMSRGGGCSNAYAVARLSSPEFQHRFLCTGHITRDGVRAPDLSTLWYGGIDTMDEALEWAEVVNVHWWRQYPEWGRIAASGKPIAIEMHIVPWAFDCIASFGRWHLAGEERDCQCVIFDIEGARVASLEQGMDPATVTHIVNVGSDMTPFAFEAPHVREKYERHFVIGVMPEFYKPRTDPALVAMLHAIQDKVPQAQFRVVGEGPLLSEIRKQCAGLDCEFPGYVPSLAKEMAGWDLCFATYPERSFMTTEIRLEEAMASSLPVVLRTSRDGAANWVGETEGGIMLGPEAGAGEVAFVIEGLAKSHPARQAMGEAAKRYAFRHLGAKAAMRRLNAIWGRMAGRQ